LEKLAEHPSEQDLTKDNYITSGHDFQGISGLHRFWQHDPTLLIDNDLHA
jgi:hypothetical protein